MVCFKYRRQLVCMLLWLAGVSVLPCSAKTRWSSLHIIPDADLIRGGYFITEGLGYYFVDSDTGGTSPAISGGGLIRLGIIEWVNIHLGYAGGPTIGFKARILGETKPWMPSLAVGAHNVFAHKEASYFDADSAVAEDMANEFYCVLGKSIEQLKTRFHLGVQSIPTNEKEVVNPVLGIEKYFGAGVYTTIEVHRRDEEIVPSLFVTWRTLKKRIQIAAGIVDLAGFLFDKGEFRFALSDPAPASSLVHPGIWFGVAYNGNLGFGKKAGFASIDDRLAKQERIVYSLRDEVDSLKRMTSTNKEQLHAVSQSLGSLVDSMPSDREQLRLLLLDKIISLKSLYEAVPFEPEKVKQTIREIANFREKAVPPLKEIVLDKSEDRYVRMLSAALLGEIGNKAASDVLLNILSEEEDPGIRIEILIALGKMRETQGIYLMEQLANDPDDGVALAAQEVLQKLSKETGVTLSPELKMRDITTQNPESVMEKKTFGNGADTAIEAPQVYEEVGEDTTGLEQDQETVAPEPVDTVGLDTGGGQPEQSVPEAEDNAEIMAEDSDEGPDSAQKNGEKAENPPQTDKIDENAEEEKSEVKEEKDTEKNKKRGIRKLFGRDRDEEEEDSKSW
ncbi:MAG: hypothetical protein GF350_17160 [Chitinivibrionales bacterium]|nr:hypothetical protein [Chitinivibrionales bacterium]